MKAYLITTGSIFAIITALHIWKFIAEWPPKPMWAGLLMIALTILPAALAIWAFRLATTKNDSAIQ